MPDEISLFQTSGKSWSERAHLGELDAVLTGSGNHVRNVFLHNAHVFAANKALKFLHPNGRVVDFGCGTGRFTRFFAVRGFSVLATEVTKEMLEHTIRSGLPGNCKVMLTNGINIPSEKDSIDLVWICSVLRYSLNVSNPVYDQIAREMSRVVKPGGRVVNVEMYVEQPASDFTRDFESAGFETEAVRVINRHNGCFERMAQWRRMPVRLVGFFAKVIAFLRYHFDTPSSLKPGLRDYVFVWRKPSC